MFSFPGGTRNYWATRKNWTTREGYTWCQGKLMWYKRTAAVFVKSNKLIYCSTCGSCQGEPGPRGPPGAVGESGVGLPGPKVSPAQVKSSQVLPWKVLKKQMVWFVGRQRSPRAHRVTWTERWRIPRPSSESQPTSTYSTFTQFIPLQPAWCHDFTLCLRDFQDLRVW